MDAVGRADVDYMIFYFEYDFVHLLWEVLKPSFE